MTARRQLHHRRGCNVRAEPQPPRPSTAYSLRAEPSRATLAASESPPHAACEPSHRQRVCEREASVSAAALDCKHPLSSMFVYIGS